MSDAIDLFYMTKIWRIFDAPDLEGIADNDR